MPLATILLLLSLLALVLSKIADVLTTIRGIRGAGGHATLEKNPLARSLMQRCGLIGGIAVIAAIWVVIVVITYISAWFSPPWMQIVTAAVAFLVAYVQSDVARANAGGKQSKLTTQCSRFFDYLRRCM